MNCSSNVIRFSLHISNLITAVSGILLAAFGITMVNKIGDLTKYEAAGGIKTLPTLVIVLGFFIVAGALLGSFGVYAEKTIFLIAFGGVTLVLLILQLIMVIWVFVHMEEIKMKMNYIVEIAWVENNLPHSYPMDTLQIQFNCCGIYDWKDYYHFIVPNSCCGAWILAGCPSNVYTTKTGCRDAFLDFATKNYAIIKFSGIILILVQLFSLFVTFHLVKALRKSNSS